MSVKRLMNINTNLGGSLGNGNSMIPPSSIVQVSDLPSSVDDKSLITLFNRFGAVRNLQHLTGSNSALVEFVNQQDAINLVTQGRTMPFFVGTTRVKLEYGQIPQPQQQQPMGIMSSMPSMSSTAIPSIEEQMQMGGMQKVLHFTIANATYPINVDVMKTICTSAGSKVLRIFIGKKKHDNSVEALVELESVADAANALDNLNGADIYSGCCTLTICYATVPRVQVFKNDQESWDFTTDTPGLQTASTGLLGAQPKRPGLLDGGGASTMQSHPMGMGGSMMMQQQKQHQQHQSVVERMKMASGVGDGSYSAFSTGEGVVLMVYNMNGERTNCHHLFNLFCLYGNVARIKFLKSRDGCAMIQMGSRDAAEHALKHLEGVTLFDSQIEITRSKQTEVQTHPKPAQLPDGSPIVVDFQNDANNRFKNAEVAARARILPPFATLHFFNAPPTTTEQDIRSVYENAENCPKPTKVVVFNVKPGQKTSIGLIEFDSVDEAIDGLAITNHSEMVMPGKNHPYHLKLAFSTKPIDEKDAGPGGLGMGRGRGRGRGRGMGFGNGMPVKPPGLDVEEETADHQQQSRKRKAESPPKDDQED